jgi:uncharacterized protein YjbI with pentapeptide repeats
MADVSLAGSTLANVDLTGVSIRQATMTGMTIDGVLVSELLQRYRG